MAGKVDNLTPFTTDNAAENGAKGGTAKKGSKHLSTWIQELFNDEKFQATIREGLKIVDYKGAPIKAIVKAQMLMAMNGDTKAFDVLGKYGYGTKLELANNPDNPITPTADPLVAAEFAEYLKNKSK